MQKYVTADKREDLSSKLSENALIVDKSIIYILFNEEYKSLILDLYEQVFIPPKMYSYFVNVLSIDELKILKKYVKKSNFKAEELEIQDVIKRFPDMSEDEAFGLLCGKKNEINVILDDPNVARELRFQDVNTLRLSDIIRLEFDAKAAVQSSI